MIEVTENASAALREILVNQGLDHEYGMRVGVKTSSDGYTYSLSLALPSNYDERFGSSEGGHILVDEDHLPRLEGATIDFTGIPASGEFNFEITNPNQPPKSSGGCGGCSSGGCSSGGCSSGGCGGCSSH